MHKVLLIRNDDLGWGELAQAIRQLPAMVIVGDTMNTDEGVDLATTHQPSLILAAATVNGEVILALLNQLQREHSPRSKVVIFCNHWDPSYLLHFPGGGIVGFFRWSDLTISLLPMCLLLVATGNIGLGSWIVTQDVLTAMSGMLQVPEPVPGVSQRDRAILDLLARGLTREEIARDLSLSLGTVKRQIAMLEDKLEAPNAFVLGLQAVRHGLLR